MLQTALCYLEAMRMKVPGLRDWKRMGKARRRKRPLEGSYEQRMVMLTCHSALSPMSAGMLQRHYLARWDPIRPQETPEVIFGLLDHVSDIGSSYKKTEGTITSTPSTPSITLTAALPEEGIPSFSNPCFQLHPGLLLFQLSMGEAVWPTTSRDWEV
jgi:hypothetical protein